MKKLKSIEYKVTVDGGSDYQQDFIHKIMVTTLNAIQTLVESKHKKNNFDIKIRPVE